MAMLGGIGVGGAIGGVTGALIGLGIPEYEAKRYEGRIKRGGLLLSVHCDDSDWSTRAKNILRQTGGDDVASGFAWLVNRSFTWMARDKGAPALRPVSRAGGVGKE